MDENDKRAWYGDDATTKRIMLESEKEYAINDQAMNVDLQRTDDTLRAIGLRRGKVEADGVYLSVYSFYSIRLRCVFYFKCCSYTLMKIYHR
jgi:hypothetical protein